MAVLLTSSAMIGACRSRDGNRVGPQTVAASVLLTLSLLVGWSHLPGRRLEAAGNASVETPPSMRATGSDAPNASKLRDEAVA